MADCSGEVIIHGRIVAGREAEELSLATAPRGGARRLALPHVRSSGERRRDLVGAVSRRPSGVAGLALWSATLCVRIEASGAGSVAGDAAGSGRAAAGVSLAGMSAASEIVAGAVQDASAAQPKRIHYPVVCSGAEHPHSRYILWIAVESS